MRDESFELFIDTFGEACSTERAPRASIEKYRQILPPALLTIWEDEGWCCYADGLFWTVNPDEYARLASMWIKGTPYESIDRYHIIARNAFGNLYAWGERNNQNITIDCAGGWIMGLADKVAVPYGNPDLMLQTFFATINPRLLDLKDESDQPLFHSALKTLGALDKTEMYGFEPALLLGGDVALKNIRKVNLDVHLTLLRGFAAPSVPLLEMEPDF